jgi:CheY-like chemotaxis protein
MHALLPTQDSRPAISYLCYEKPFNILLVEDTMSDALLIRTVLDDSCVPYRLQGLRGGDEVLPWLQQALMHDALPDVILLDLGLPRMDGFELLSELAATVPALRAIPIIILTGYEDFEYVRNSYNVHVPAYLTKPCDPEKLRLALLSAGQN